MPSRKSLKNLVQRLSTLMFALLEVLGLPRTPGGPAGKGEKAP